MKAEFAHVQGYTEDGKLGGRMKASWMNRRECSPESASSYGESWTDMIMRETHSSRYDTVKDAPCHAKEGINREVLEARSTRDSRHPPQRECLWAADQKVSHRVRDLGFTHDHPRSLLPPPQNPNTQAWLSTRLCTLLTRCAISYPEQKPADLTRCDQYGRPFIILREQGRKVRTHGVEAIKVRKSLFFLLGLSGPDESTATHPSRKDSRQHHPDIVRTKRFFHHTRNIKRKLKYSA